MRQKQDKTTAQNDQKKFGEHCKENLHLNQQSKIKDCERTQIEKQLLTEKRFRELLIQTAPIIIMVLNKQGCIELINPYMEELTGYTLSEVKGKDWFKTFLPVHVQDEIRQLFFKAINHIHSHGNINPIVTKGNKEIPISWYDNTIQDSDGNVTGLLCMGLDVSKRSPTTQDEKSLDQLKSDFLERMGHEIRTPMNAIFGFSEILSETICDPQQKEYLNTIKSSCEALLQLFAHSQKAKEPQFSAKKDTIDPKLITFKKNTKILVVDDISTNRYILTHFLKAFDFQILQAENGNVAIEMTKAHQPDLVFMDYHMPVLDGYKAAKIIKNIHELSRIPIVFVTASVTQDVLDKIESEGFSYIKKPFHLNKITTELMQHIPYSQKNNNQADHEKNAKTFIDLNPELVHNIPELKQILRTQFYPKWETIKEKLYIDDIKQWTTELKEQSLHYSCKPLLDYSNRLLENIDSFDLVRLQNDLKLFSNLFK